MRIFPPEVEVGDYEGFTPEKDIFRRKEFGESLRSLFGNVEDPMVAILDEPWGAGKSTFIKMWCGHMRLHGFPVIYFDAFKHDYSDDAFIAIAGEVVAAAQELDVPSSTTQDFIDNAAQVGVQVASAVGKGIIKRGLQKFVGKEGEEELSEILTESTQVAFDGMESILKAKLASRRQERKSFKNFSKILDSVAINMSSQLQDYLVANDIDGNIPNEENSKRPLIIVIDELDRCKPTFALDVLEKIKHFFSREGIHFFLVTHMEQLECAVSSSYGLDTHAGTYLEKFYDLRVKFPNKDNSAVKTVYSFGHYLLDIIDCEQDSRSDSFVHALEMFCEDHEIELRTMSKIATRYFLARRGSLAKDNPYILLFLCFTLHLDESLYSKIRSGTNSVQDIQNVIYFNETDREEDPFSDDLICCLVPFERMNPEWQKRYHDGQHANWNYKRTTRPLIKIIDSIL
ncbi:MULTISPECIES: KAP family P-loop NTPase fold protein [unclassified Maridesulfovibrio]|uniref:KAP family P-loop NTPase fold protein n=1 Tax=unclassified Maridesulfovibrio TaxID=2794999 RepID=UPI003B40390E